MSTVAKTPLSLVPDVGSHELATVLTALLDMAHSGDLSGLVFGAQFKGNKYYVETAGSLHRDPIRAMGVATQLWASIERRLREECQETLL